MKNKSLGLKSSKIYGELFGKEVTEEFFAEVLAINGKCYIVFYFGKEHQLRIFCVSEEMER
jgi:hypothetical protein